MKKQPQFTIKLKCVICGHRWDFTNEKLPPGDHPACPKCYGPAIPVKATVK